MSPSTSSLLLRLCFIVNILVSFSSSHSIPKSPFRSLPHKSPQSYAQTHHGAVACEHETCTQVGIDVLRAGGNAADALIATTFCVGVVAPYHSGIGGGSFSLIRKPDVDSESRLNEQFPGDLGSPRLDRFEVLDYRETAPALAHRDMYAGREHEYLLGGLSVAVPGEVRGLALLHARHGRLLWTSLLEPSIQLARHGFVVHQTLADIMNFTMRNVGSFLVDDADWAVDFAPQGRLLELGEIITLRRLADSLEAISVDPEVFYTGSMARSLAATIHAHGGVVSVDDMGNYTVEMRKPVQTMHRGHRVVSVGAPASGAIALSTLNIMDGYADTGDEPNVNLTTHRLIEAFRFAYSQRTLLGDPSFVPNMTAYEDHILSRSTAESIRSRITDRTHEVEYYNPEGYEIKSTAGTSHILATDSSGLTISTTSTINTWFGSCVRDAETGIILNNEMNDFSVPTTDNKFGFVPSPNNYIEPGKRPLSSMSPVIVERERHGEASFLMGTGAAGGSTIISATAQFVWRFLDAATGPDTPRDDKEEGSPSSTSRSGLEVVLDTTSPGSESRWLKRLLAVERLHDQVVPYQVDFESGFDAGVVVDMQVRGHNVTVGNVASRSEVHAICAVEHGNAEDGRDDTRRIFEAASDPRSLGGAGYSF